MFEFVFDLVFVFVFVFGFELFSTLCLISFPLVLFSMLLSFYMFVVDVGFGFDFVSELVSDLVFVVYTVFDFVSVLILNSIAFAI